MNEPWLERWREGRTGWHEPEGNRNLKTHWAGTGKRVLVPLCGKTPDLLWLEARGNDVVGVELAEMAVRGFFEDNALDYRRSTGRCRDSARSSGALRFTAATISSVGRGRLTRITTAVRWSR